MILCWFIELITYFFQFCLKKGVDASWPDWISLNWNRISTSNSLHNKKTDSQLFVHITVKKTFSVISNLTKDIYRRVPCSSTGYINYPNGYLCCCVSELSLSSTSFIELLFVEAVSWQKRTWWDFINRTNCSVSNLLLNKKQSYISLNIAVRVTVV